MQRAGKSLDFGRGAVDGMQRHGEVVVTHIGQFSAVGKGRDVQAENIAVLRQSPFFHRPENRTAALRLKGRMSEFSGVGQRFLHLHGKGGEVFGQVDFRQRFRFKGKALSFMGFCFGNKPYRRQRQNSGLVQYFGNALVHEPFHDRRMQVCT